MTDNNIRRILRARFDDKQNKMQAKPGVLGDGDGNVEVPSLQNYVYVRIADAVEQVYNVRATAENDVLVMVGYDPIQPTLYQVLSTRTTAPGGANNPTAYGYAPAVRYQWMAEGGGQDPLFSDLRQFLPLRVSTFTGMYIQIYQGAIKSGTDWVDIQTQTKLLSSHIPSTAGNAAFVLITVDSSGGIVATKGTETTVALLDLSLIPAPPTGTLLELAAVRVYNGQTVIQEGRVNTDIKDLRQPYGMNSSGIPAPSLALDDLTDVDAGSPADQDALIWDVNANAWIAKAVTPDLSAYLKLDASNGPVTEDLDVHGVPVGLGGGAVVGNPGIGVYGNIRVGVTLEDNVDGYDITAIGGDAAGSNVDGYTIVAIGSAALKDNVSSGLHVAIGSNAYTDHTAGSGGTVIGVDAMFLNASGDNNTAVGIEAGARIVGNGSAGTPTTTENSVYVGARCRTGTSDAVNEIVIGFEAKGLGDNTAVIGNDDTTLVKLGPGAAVSSIGGRLVKLTNRTGAATVKGKVVCASDAYDNAVKLVVQNQPDAIGVFYEAGVADGGEAWIVTEGNADVYFIGSTTRGYIARTFVTADSGYVTGQAMSEAVPSSPFASDKHFCEIGHVLQSRSGAGLARCKLHFN